MLSISPKNGEEDIYCKALLIASFPKFWGVDGSPWPTCILNLLDEASLTTIRWGEGPLLLSFCGGKSTLLYLLGGETDLFLYHRGG